MDRHWRDLVQRVKPDILWNDLGVPQDFRTEALIADYYNRVPGGIVNDRFSLGLYPGVQKALQSLEVDGLVAGRPVGRTRVFQMDPRYFAHDALKQFLRRLTEP